jgi:hypothetical protein
MTYVRRPRMPARRSGRQATRAPRGSSRRRARAARSSCDGPTADPFITSVEKHVAASRPTSSPWPCRPPSADEIGDASGVAC